MNILTPEVVAILMLDFIFFLLLGLAAVVGVSVIRRWDMSSTSPGQYRLEKQGYLAAAIVKFIIILKIPLIAYFVFVQDKLALVIPGAMCAAGVINSTQSGTWLFGFKLLNLFLFGFWLILNHYDMRHETLPYTRKKFKLLVLVFFLFSAELLLEWNMFQALNPQKLVSCCGSIYAKAASGLSWRTWADSVHVIFFYVAFALLVVFFALKRWYLFAVANIVFLSAALFSLIAFFSTYIYELPTHRCPFCLLQGDYCGIGYLLYILLFGGVFSGLAAWVLKIMTKENPKSWYNLSMYLNLAYVVLVSLYPVLYFLRNGVLLKNY